MSSLKQRYHEIHEEEILLNDDEKKIRKKTDICCNSLIFVAPAVFILSIMAGVVFYCSYERWELSTAIYYSTQALLGCMYGVPGNIDTTSNVFTLLLFIYGSTLVAGAIGAFATTIVDNATKVERQRLKLYEPVDEDRDGSIGIGDWINYYVNNILVNIGWTTHYRKYLTFLSMILWLGLGVYYGSVYEKWSFGFSLYYSIAAISSSGAAPPVCIGDDDDHCSLGEFRALFMTFYLCIGVPLFTLTLGQFSLALVERAVRSRELDAMLQPLTEDEFNFASTLNTRNPKEGIDFAQFLVMEMLRLKRFDREDIFEIKELFNAIDYNNEGVITTEKLHKCHLFYSDQENNNSNDNDNQYNTFEAPQDPTNPSTTPTMFNNILNNLRNQPLADASKQTFSGAAKLVLNANRLRRNTTSNLSNNDDGGESDVHIGSRLRALSTNLRRYSVDSNNFVDSADPTSNRKPFQP